MNEFIAYMADGGMNKNNEGDPNIKMQSVYIPDDVSLVSLPSMKIGGWRKGGIADMHVQRLRIVAGEWAKDPKLVQRTLNSFRLFEEAKRPATFDDYTRMIQDGSLPDSNVFRRLNEDGHYMTIVRHPKNNICALHSAVIFGLHDENTTIGRYDKNVNIYIVNEALPDDKPVLIGTHNFAKGYILTIQVPQGDYFSIQVGENVNQRIPLPRPGRASGARVDLAK